MASKDDAERSGWGQQRELTLPKGKRKRKETPSGSGDTAWGPQRVLPLPKGKKKKSSSKIDPLSAAVQSQGSSSGRPHPKKKPKLDKFDDDSPPKYRPEQDDDTGRILWRVNDESASRPAAHIDQATLLIDPVEQLAKQQRLDDLKAAIKLIGSFKVDEFDAVPIEYLVQLHIIHSLSSGNSLEFVISCVRLASDLQILRTHPRRRNLARLVIATLNFDVNNSARMLEFVLVLIDGELNGVADLLGSTQPLALLPPTAKCLKCSALLCKPYVASVDMFTMHNVGKCCQMTLACPSCSLRYNHWEFAGNMNQTEDSPTDDCDVGSDQVKYYYEKCLQDRIQFVRISTRAYMHKKLCEWICALGHHAWVTFQGFTESFIEMMHYSGVANAYSSSFGFTRKRVAQACIEYFGWRHLTKGLDQPIDLVANSEAASVPSTDSATHHVQNKRAWKSVSRPLLDADFLEKFNEIRSKRMQHKLTHVCEKTRCHLINVGDGNFKLESPVCLFRLVRNGFNNTKYLEPCHKQPIRGTAFCKVHFRMAQQRGWPTRLRAFLEKFGSDSKLVNAAFREAEELAKLEGENDDVSVLAQRKGRLAAVLEATAKVNDILDAAADPTEESAEEPDPNLPRQKMKKALHFGSADTEVDAAANSQCSKDVGRKKRMCAWSRGQFFIVASCGSILRFEPLYGAEAPTYVAYIVLDHIKNHFEELKLPPEEWKTFTFVYDNMCHLDNLKALKKPLPKEAFPPPYNYMWKKITKCIDGLHIQNHQDKCKEDYHPSKIDAIHGDGFRRNTMVAEQTFVWASRFKKQLCATQKNMHNFLLHMFVERRNEYVFQCHSNCRQVVAPKVRSASTK